MPFLRISRDKRGYEYFSLVHTTSGRRGKVRQRVLYWFRTPPGIKVGRSPLDDDVTRALEAQHPDVKFDWEALRNTPIPPVTIDWRERRLAQRAARQFRDADDEVPAAVSEEPATRVEAEAPAGGDSPGVPALALDAGPGVKETAADYPQGEIATAESTAVAAESTPAEATGSADPAIGSPHGASPPAGAARKRRRRRRGRRNRPTAAPGTAQAEPVPSTSEDHEPNDAPEDDDSGAR